MELMYSSTRNDKVKLTASQAILKGLADDGGLFVPERIPALDVPMDTLADMSYQETAYEVMSRFFTDFTEDELKDCIKKASQQPLLLCNITFPWCIHLLSPAIAGMYQALVLAATTYI